MRAPDPACIRSRVSSADGGTRAPLGGAADLIECSAPRSGADGAFRLLAW